MREVIELKKIEIVEKESEIQDVLKIVNTKQKEIDN